MIHRMGHLGQGEKRPLDREIRKRQSLDIPRQMMYGVGSCENDRAAGRKRKPDQARARDLQ